MTINLHLPPKQETLLRPTITVVGVGGAGGNAVNNMIAAGLEGVNFVVANTDAQALDNALTDRAIQLGADITRGLGAGANPDVGRAAADESNDEIASHINGSHMVFITAGMGGGTGTGAAPVVARIAREQGILTVGVVTKPFQFEGTHRMKMAEAGIEELQKFVDTLIVIPNQNLFRVANERTTFADAFRMADEVLHSGVRGVTDLMVKPGLVNLDFADIRTVMGEMGKAMMGTGEAAGERRAIEAAEAAISNPLLDDVSLKGARAVLINITGGLDMTLFEVDEAANRIRDEVDPDANIIFGSTFNETMEGKMRVSVVATGIEAAAQQNRPSAADGAKRPFSFPNTPRPEVPRLSKPVATPLAASLPPPREAQNFAEPVMARVAGASPLTSQSRFNFVQNAAMQQEADSPPETAAAKENALSFAFTVTTIGAAQPTEQFDEQQRMATPQAEAPAANPTVQQVRALYAQRPVPEYNSPRQSRPTQPDRDEPTVLSFFQRVAGMGKALAAARSETPERAVQVSERPRAVEKPRAELAEKRQPQPQEEEYLDIPAFLRRQAN